MISHVKRVFFVSRMTRAFKEANWPRGRAIYSWLRHCGMCCAREETVTKYNRRTDPLSRVFRSFGPSSSQGLAPVLVHASTRRGPFFPESPHRHARTHARGKSAALSFFSRPRDISGRALVTGYAPTSRQTNFWQSSTAPRCAAESRANFGGHRTNH